MRLGRQILTKNDYYTRPARFTPKGVMVHSTGANNPKVSRYVPGNEELGYNTGGNHWNQPGYLAVHAFLGRFADGEVGVVQTLPWDFKGGHCGAGKGGSGNNTHIAFEICEDGLTDPAYFRAVYQEAVELTAMLCQQYGLDPLADGVVICHGEGHTRGIASNHKDVLHWWPKMGKTMDDFRADVARELKGEDDNVVCYKTIDDVPDYYRAAIQKLLDKGALVGTGDGLNVSEDLCRTLTILDRLGKLD